MKDITSAVVVFFIALFAFTKLAGPIPLSVSSVVTSKSDTFTVTGEGKVTATPDIAVVTAGVQTQGATVKQIQQELNTKINKITDAIKKLGVDSKDIQTTNYNVSPIYDYRNGTQRITGYQANSNVTIKVRNLDSANGVVDAATANGANQIGGISFDVSDKTKAENEARTKAVEEAKKKAELAAKTAGFSLGKVINYNENFGGVPRPLMYAKAEMDLAAGNAAPTQIEPGSSEIVVSVSLSYEIR
jgi:uncharacterized protein